MPSSASRDIEPTPDPFGRDPARPVWRIRSFDETPSTNQTVLAAGERGEPEWTVHIARRQSQGRGRGDHIWWSPAGGGLWMSILLRPRLAPERLGGLALLGGLAARRGLDSLGARPIDLYWPNDLYHRGRKLGGVLGEVRGVPGPPSSTVVALGIGVNIDLADLEVPASLRGAVASAAEAGCRVRDPLAIAGAILERMEPLYREFEGGATVRDLVGDSMAGIGRRVRVRAPPGPPWGGTMLGIGESGELLVIEDGGPVRGLWAAEVDYGD